MDDETFGLSWEGLLIGGLIGALLASGRNDQRALEAGADQRAIAEQAVVDRGYAAHRAARQFGMTPDLAADILRAEDVIRGWQARADSQRLAHQLRHLRDAGRWATFLTLTALWSTVAFLPVWFVTALAGVFILGISIVVDTWWQALLVGCWPALIAIGIAIHLDNRARRQVPNDLRATLHRHGRRWHAHHEHAHRYHRHPGDPDGPPLPC